MGVGGGMPAPRKLSAASAMITTPMLSVTRTMNVLSTFGRMWVSMMRGAEQPRTLASATKSRCFKCQHLAADDPREARPEQQADGDHQRAEALPHRHGQQEREQDGRKGEGRIDQAHQDAFDDAAHVAGDDADDQADAAAGRQRQQPLRSG